MGLKTRSAHADGQVYCSHCETDRPVTDAGGLKVCASCNQLLGIAGASE